MTLSRYEVGQYAAGEAHLLTTSERARRDGSEWAVIAIHGHGGDATQFETLTAYQGAHVDALANAGLLVYSIDAGGIHTWSNDTAMSAISSAYSWITDPAKGGAKAGKVGIMGWSMGGGNSLNWIKRNAAKVARAWLWVPESDLDFFHGTPGYTPSYATGGIALGGYAAEIDAAYGGNYAANAPGHKIRDEYASWNGLGVPITIAHAVDDGTIPIAQNRDAFVPGVNDPNVTFRSVPGGGHDGLFNYVPTDEVVAFYAGMS